MEKKVAILGSSGGNLYSLGGKEPVKLLEELLLQLEAAYLFMFSSKFIFAGAVISSGLGGLLVDLFDVRGTAYVPSVMAPLLSNNMGGFIIAMIGSLLCAFIITLSVNLVAKKKVKNKPESLSA